MCYARNMPTQSLGNRDTEAGEHGGQHMPGGRPAQKKAPAFGARLAALRKQCGLSQAQFAEKAEVSREMVGYYERRTDNPESAFVVKAASVLGCTTDELLGVQPGKAKKVGRKSKLDRYVEEAKKLPKADRDYVVRFLEQVLDRKKR